MQFDIFTLFPEMFSGYLEESLLQKARQSGLVNVRLHDYRRFTTDKHGSVDDRPFGGGPGMVIMAPPVVECVEAVWSEAKLDTERVDSGPEQEAELVLLTPQGEPLNQVRVEQLARLGRLGLICGRYEGFDQRVVDILQPREVSIGDYVLNGGEVAAMVLVDAIVRLIPGFLGQADSHRDDSFSGRHRWLEYPQYTRPRTFRGRDVPEVLLSGDHSEIARWRQQQSYQRTRQRRADLLHRPGEAGGETG